MMPLKFWQKGVILGVTVGLLKVLLQLDYHMQILIESSLFKASYIIFYRIIFFGTFFGLISYLISTLFEIHRKRQKILQKQLILGLIIIPVITYTFLNTLWFIFNLPIGVKNLSINFIGTFIGSIVVGFLTTPFLIIYGYYKRKE